MSCGCGCNNCGGTSVPRTNGTEVTLLSGTLPKNQVRENGENSSSTYYILGAAAVVAAAAFFLTKSK